MCKDLCTRHHYVVVFKVESSEYEFLSALAMDVNVAQFALITCQPTIYSSFHIANLAEDPQVILNDCFLH